VSAGDSLTYEEAGELLGLRARTVWAMACPGGLLESAGEGRVSRVSVEMRKAGLTVERKRFPAAYRLGQGPT
jgi:hypothetical protein